MSAPEYLWLDYKTVYNNTAVSRVCQLRELILSLSESTSLCKTPWTKDLVPALKYWRLDLLEDRLQPCCKFKNQLTQTVIGTFETVVETANDINKILLPFYLVLTLWSNHNVHRGVVGGEEHRRTQPKQNHT